MSDLSVGGASRRHFSAEEENALQGESTSAIVKRDGKLNVDIHGADLSQRELTREQQSHVGIQGKLEIGHAVFEGADLAELEIVAGAAAGAAVIASAVSGYGLMLASLAETEKQRDEQKNSIDGATLHAGLVGALDLPQTYRSRRIEGDFHDQYKEVLGKGAAAMPVVNALKEDTKGLALLQARADGGMIAARDMVSAGIENKDAFLRAHPNIAKRYTEDAAFHEGFDAYVYTTEPKERAALDAKLDGQNARAAQTQYSVRG